MQIRKSNLGYHQLITVVNWWGIENPDERAHVRLAGYKAEHAVASFEIVSTPAGFITRESRERVNQNCLRVQQLARKPLNRYDVVITTMTVEVSD